MDSKQADCELEISRDQHNGAPDATPEPEQNLGAQFWLAFWSLAMTNLAVALDATTLTVAIPTISKAIGGTTLDAFWAGTSYLLASTTTMMIFVSLSDGFGRRLMMITSLVIFGVGSVICAVAHTYHVLIAGRTVQGFGGGGLLALNVVLVTDLVPLKARGGFYGIISIVYAIGSVTGPVIGGALATEGQWRWIFWLNVPIVGVALVGIILFLKLSQRNGSFAEKLRGIDYIGFVLFGASLTSFLISITWGGIQYAWSSWQTLLPLILGAVGLITFVLYERYLAKNPFVPMGIFINYTVCILFAGSFVHGVILYAIAYYMPEYYLSAKSYTPVISGVAALPQTATLVPSAGVVGFLVDKTGRYRAIMWVGWALTTLGVGLLTYLDIDISVPGWIFLTAVSGLGLGVLFPVQELALQASVEPESVAMSATMVLFFRSLGQAVGVAIGSTILEDRMQVELAKPYLADILPASLQGLETIELIGVIRTLPAHSALANAIKVGLVRSFQIIWAVVCALSGVAMICHFVMREYSMDQEHITDQGYRQESDTRQQSEANADREK